MDLNKKLEELKPYQLNCNVFDVYSYNGLSMQDLLCQFFTKINECVSLSNNTIDLAKWLVNEGLELEVAKKLVLWLEDGTLENIINVNLFNSLDNKINSLGLQLGYKVNKYRDIDSIKNVNFHEGEVVFIENFYGNIKNNSHHFRIISSLDNGTGELLNNGKYANLIFDDYINITHIGAYNSNEHGSVCDIKPFIDKIVSINPLPKIKIPKGMWAISTNNYVIDGLQIEGVSDQVIWKYPETTNINTTILFPLHNNQDSVLSVGNTLKETRGFLLKGVNIVTNKYEYENGVLTVTSNGANVGLDLKTVCFSKVRDIIVSGNNNNVIYGVKFNGFEVYWEDIMFRIFGKAGSDAQFAFYTYSRTNDGVYSEPSGLIYSKISFEGVGCSWMKVVGVDVHVIGVNGEIGWFTYAEGVTQLSTSNLTSNYKPLCLFAVDSKTNAVNISNVTVQGLGKLCFQKGTDQYCMDTLVRTDDVYGDFSNFIISNVYMQDNKKDVYAINYLYGSGNTDSNGDNPNKTIKSVNNISADNYKVLYKMKDNHIPRVGYIGCTKTNGLMKSDNIIKVVENTLYPKDSSIQHNVCFDNVNQQEYIKTLRKKYTDIEDIMFLFKTNDSLEQGVYKFVINYKMRWATPSATFKIKFKDGSEHVETVNFPPRDNDCMRTKVITVDNSTITKDIDYVCLINTTKNYDFRFYSMRCYLT